MNELSEMIVQAVSTIVENSKKDDLSLIQCTIANAVDKEQGIYTINYKGNTDIKAYSLDTTITYASGTTVFVLCTEGNISNTKVILGSSGKTSSKQKISMAINEDNCLNINY